MTSAPRRPRAWIVRAVLVAVAIVSLPPGSAVLAGGFLPGVPAVAPFGSLLDAGLAWVWLSVGGAAILSAVAVALGGRRATPVLLALALLATAGAGIVTYREARFADRNYAPFDILRELAPTATSAVADAYPTYATVAGVDLHAGLWRPQPHAPGQAQGGRAALVYVHGGAYVAGGLDMRPQMFAALAQADVVVVDVEYRLAPPPRWQDAPGDVLCALAWLRTIATTEGINPDRIVVMGESAGGGLALVAAYAAGTDQVSASCPGQQIVPAGVIAVAPTADLAGIWQDATLTAAGLRFPEAYTGGTPADVPDRYAMASPFRLVRPGLPPTLLLTGENDHLVLGPRVRSVADALIAAGDDVRLLVIPFADHGFDGQPAGFGAQMEASIVLSFIAEVTGQP
jgi:acetyl esterase/lipase